MKLNRFVENDFRGSKTLHAKRCVDAVTNGRHFVPDGGEKEVGRKGSGGRRKWEEGSREDEREKGKGIREKGGRGYSEKDQERLHGWVRKI